MKLIPPFDIVSQGFGANANPLYAGQGLKGHPGIDFAVSYGTPIPSAVDSYCYSLINKDNPDLMKYRAVCTIVDDGDISYEIVYGHCSTIQALSGSVYDRGDTLAKVGNTGDVFAGGIPVTKAEKDAGSHKGEHLHFQVRKLLRTKTKPLNIPCIYDANGIYQRNGYYYLIPEWTNGYNGCIDPAQFFPFIFTKNLWIGMNNSDVKELQKRLDVIQTGFFGTLTFNAVRAYQTSKGISPTGFVGILTRTALNATM